MFILVYRVDVAYPVPWMVILSPMLKKWYSLAGGLGRVLDRADPAGINAQRYYQGLSPLTANKGGQFVQYPFQALLFTGNAKMSASWKTIQTERLHAKSLWFKGFLLYRQA